MVNTGQFIKGQIPWNKGKKLDYKVWNAGLIGLPPRHTIPHNEETKLKCSMAQKRRWELGAYKNRPSRIPIELIEFTKKHLKKGWNITCKNCNKKFFASPSYIKKGRLFCGSKCYFEFNIGKNHPRYNGYSDKYPYKHIRLKKYKIWRGEVFERDNYICQMCNTRGVYLHPHHIKSYTYFPKLRYEVSNGVTLCVDCHRKVHSLLGNIRRCFPSE